MKKILLSLMLFVFIAIGAKAAEFDNVLNNVNDVLNRIDRTEYTINRINRLKNKLPKQTVTKQKSKQTKVKTNRSQKQETYNNDNNYYNVDTNDFEYEKAQTREDLNNEPEDLNFDYNKTIVTEEPKTIADLQPGAVVIDPTSVWTYKNGSNYSNSDSHETFKHPVVWIKLEDNHYKAGATLFLAKHRVAKYDFCHSQKGLRAWDESDIRRFLRTTFYSHLSDGFKQAIVNTNIPFADLSGNPKNIEDNFFLLSIVEWGASDRAHNGKAIKYDLPSIYRVYGLEYKKDGNYYLEDGFIAFHTTRTINRPKAISANYTNDVFELNADGTLCTSIYFQGDVIPAINLKSTTKIKGPYKTNIYKDYKSYLNDDGTGKNKLIYYILDFS